VALQVVQDFVDSGGLILGVVQEPRPRRQQDAVPWRAVVAGLDYPVVVDDARPGRPNDLVQFAVVRFGLAARLAADEHPKQATELRGGVDRVLPRDDARPECFED